MVKYVTFFILVTFVSLPLIQAQVITPPTSEQKIPFELQGIGVDEKTGTKIDLSLSFTDESGKSTRLGTYFNGTRPVVLALVYYGCPNLCSLVLNSAIDSLKEINLRPGIDYEIVAISFDPRETTSLALEKKSSYVRYFLGINQPKGITHPSTQVVTPASQKPWTKEQVEQGMHFLIGSKEATTAIAEALGFHFKWDKEIKQFAHASAIYIMTPGGQVSRQFYGIMYPARDLKLSLVEAAAGKIGSVVDRLLLFCYHYDGAEKKYVVMAQKIMSIGGLVTLAILIIFMAVFWKKETITLKKPRR